MLFLSVRGFFDYAGPAGHSRLTRPTVLPSPLRQRVGILINGFSKLINPAHRCLYLRFEQHLTMVPARLKARMDTLLSFPVGLFHPLQHSGLSRRSPYYRLVVEVPLRLIRLNHLSDIPTIPQLRWRSLQ